ARLRAECLVQSDTSRQRRSLPERFPRSRRDRHRSRAGSSFPLIGFRVPKWTGQTEGSENRDHFIRAGPTTLDGETIRIPTNSELPKLLEINQRSPRNLVRRAPLIDGLFRPEEEHGRSRENEIVPPMRGRYREMRDVRFQNRRAIFYFKR